MRERTGTWLAFGATSVLLGGLICVAFAAPPKPTQAAPTPKKIDFTRDVQPIFKTSCYTCHGSDGQQAGLRLDHKAAAMKGGVSGPSIVPGHSDKSALLARVLGQGGKPRMPLGFAPLTDAQTATLKAWIDQGAVWQEGATAKHWAYVPPVRPTLPRVKNAAWVRNPIDDFVLARLERGGLTPSPPASREKLLRRVFLDLTGLPPSVKDIDAFLQDKRPDAYERVVDKLLASPHYGERMARPWLDLARYADTNGYEKDNRRSIWPYRDWVIQAFNQDMPYDRFTTEQIAGDLLPNATQADRVATGFNRNTMLNEEGGVDREEQRWLTLVDRVGTTSSTWLGTTMACAECHDHKYDPFKQKEFYQFLAFFDHSDEPDLAVPTAAQTTRTAALGAQIASLQKAVADPATVPVVRQGATVRLADLKKQLDGLHPAMTLVLQEKTDKATPTTYVHIKGSFLNKGEQVAAGVPAVLNPFPANQPHNRLGLARWLTDPKNPLTARVEVNRLWEQCWGRGLVETSEDFGTQGERPTHPQLLDWLATELVRRHWSVKQTLRLIVTSAAYRQDSRVPPALQARDPYNKLLARGPRFRMEGEMIRDVALSAGGLLSPKIGGPSVFPPQPDGIWAIPYNADQWVTSAGDDRYRRGLYTFWRRTSPYPSLTTFDAPSREACTVRRIRTDTPLQALTTLNDPAFFEAARGLARWMQREGGADPRAQIALGFRLCTARTPTLRERARLLALYRQELVRYRQDAKAAEALLGAPTDPASRPSRAALTIVANVMLNLDETLTKE